MINRIQISLRLKCHALLCDYLINTYYFGKKVTGIQKSESTESALKLFLYQKKNMKKATSMTFCNDNTLKHTTLLYKELYVLICHFFKQ